MSVLRSLRSAEVLIALALLGCFVLLGWLDYRNRTRVVEQYDTFSSYDFQPGGYRAWYDLLQREGLSVARYERRPGYLRGSIATLIVSNNAFDAALRAQVGRPSGTFSDADLEALRSWVAKGGRLVWLVDRATALGDSQGEGKRRLRKLLGGDVAPSLHIPVVTSGRRQRDAAVVIAPLPLSRGVHQLSGLGRLRLPFDVDPSITPLIADDGGSVVAWYSLGRGSIVVVTDETLFENSRLAKADNARLGYDLAAFGLRPGQVVAFEEWTHGYQSGDTWWSILPPALRLALGIAAGALLLLLLGAMWRFGPAAVLPENVERTSEEYLISMAALLKRGGATRKAVHDLALVALHGAARSVGLPDAAPASAIANRLRGSEAGDRRAHDLITLERLAGYQQPSPAELVEAARLSRSLRKELMLDGPQRLEPRRATARRSA
jgi:hypothetical protein